jgi:hypothetical protein
VIGPLPDGAHGVHPTGEIDYRLARQSVLTEFRKGRLARHEVCDAHPELIRAARNVGEETSEPCPICEQADVVHVKYLFGPGMPAQGKCVTSRAEIERQTRPGVELACYVVEVCPSCSWNHLSRSFGVTGRRRRGTGPARSG